MTPSPIGSWPSKVLPANLSEDEDFRHRFRREAHAAARLDTPHVVPIHDYGEIDGRLFVCMRLIKGRDLANALAEGPLDPDRAVASSSKSPRRSMLPMKWN
jgi:serine/threonine protein kinase